MKSVSPSPSSTPRLSTSTSTHVRCLVLTLTFGSGVKGIYHVCKNDRMQCGALSPQCLVPNGQMHVAHFLHLSSTLRLATPLLDVTPLSWHSSLGARSRSVVMIGLALTVSWTCLRPGIWMVILSCI